MVKELRKGKNIVYRCEECGLLYPIKEYAEKCEEYYKKNKSCNLEIIKHAIEFKTMNSIQ